MSLYPYLKAIQSGRTINASRFEVLLKQSRVDINDLASVSFGSPGRYSVNITNETLFSALLEKYGPSNSRAHATRQGDSHRHPTHTSYLVAKTGSSASRTTCIACNPGDMRKQLLQYPSDLPIVLIENSDCFTFSEDFLVAMELEDIAQSALVILSAGNAITHKQSIQFLQHFDRIYYCPDYDLAGIEIFETLEKSLSDKITFVIPSTLVSYAGYCFKPKSGAHFMKALSKAKKWQFTLVEEAMVKGTGFIEQEIFLGEKYE